MSLIELDVRIESDEFTFSTKSVFIFPMEFWPSWIVIPAQNEASFSIQSIFSEQTDNFLVDTRYLTLFILQKNVHFLATWSLPFISLLQELPNEGDRIEIWYVSGDNGHILMNRHDLSQLLDLLCQLSGGGHFNESKNWSPWWQRIYELLADKNDRVAWEYEEFAGRRCRSDLYKMERVEWTANKEAQDSLYHSRVTIPDFLRYSAELCRGYVRDSQRNWCLQKLLALCLPINLWWRRISSTSMHWRSVTGQFDCSIMFTNWFMVKESTSKGGVNWYCQECCATPRHVRRG
jgi:hypothetical protein